MKITPKAHVVNRDFMTLVYTKNAYFWDRTNAQVIKRKDIYNGKSKMLFPICPQSCHKWQERTVGNVQKVPTSKWQKRRPKKLTGPQGDANRRYSLETRIGKSVSGLAVPCCPLLGQCGGKPWWWHQSGIGSIWGHRLDVHIVEQSVHIYMPSCTFVEE